MSAGIPRRGRAKWPPDLTAASRHWIEDWKFPLRLARALSFFQLTQIDLEAMSGVSRFEVNRIIRGSQKTVGLDAARAIIDAFRFSPSWQSHLADALLNLDIEDFDCLAEEIVLTSGVQRARAAAPLPRNWGKGDARKSFRRAVRLAAIGFWVGWEFFRAFDEFDAWREYLTRVLRPCARVYPPAAWTLAVYMERFFNSDGGLERRRQNRWKFYKLARSGRWPRESNPVAEQLDDIGSRISRPAKTSADRLIFTHRPNRPFLNHEDVSIALWSVHRKWEPDVVEVDDEVFRLVREAQVIRPKTWLTPDYKVISELNRERQSEGYTLIHVHRAGK